MSLFSQTIVLFAALLTTNLLPEASSDAAPKRFRVYVGTYTSGDSVGIYHGSFDAASGKLTIEGETSGVKNPSFLAIHPNQKFLYAVNEVGDFQGKPAGGVSAFTIESKSGALTLLNSESSGGPGPCHIIVDSAGRNVLVANYGGGSVACLPITDDGSVKPASAFVQHKGSSVNPRRQQGPHAHSINLDSSNRFSVVADLGLDKVLVYRFDSTNGTLQPNDPPAVSVAPGGGPRHFSFHPSGRFGYVCNELHSTITAFRYDAAAGRLNPLKTVSTLPQGFSGSNSTAEVLVHPSGKFVYVSNRGHHSIAGFAISASGIPKPIQHQSTLGKTPRNFRIDPTGQFLLAANQATNNISVFRIDPQTGQLSETGHVCAVPTPVCLRLMPMTD